MYVASLWRGARSIVRSFNRAKAFVATAVLTVALGIGVNAVVFSLFDQLLFRALPYHEPHRLVQLHSGTNPSLDSVLPTAVALGLAREQNLFSGLGWAHGGELEPMSPVAGGNPLFWLTGVTTNTLEVLGIRPVIGGGMSEFPATSLDRPVLLTYDVWQRRYRASDEVLSLTWVARDAAGRDVRWSVVGVLPKGFVLPASRITTADFDGVYGFDPGFDRRLSLSAIGVAPFARLAPGVSVTAARARANGFVASAFGRLKDPFTFADTNVDVISLQSGLYTAARSYIWLAVLGAWGVLGATGLTLAILLLTWSQLHRQHAGIRLALGATAPRLIGRALAESSAICGLGAALGWLTYTGLHPLFLDALPVELRAHAFETPDVRVITVTGGLALICAVVGGTLPAIRMSHVSPLDVLRRKQGALTFDRLVGGTFLLGLQAAFGLVLLVGAMTTVPAVLRALSESPGFDAADLYFASVPTSNNRTAADAEEQVRRGREAIEIARSLPGVVAASLSLKDPFWPSVIERERLLKPSATSFAGRVLPVHDAFFAALATPIVAGRTFSRADLEEQALVAIVNEAAVRRLWPGSPAAGVLGRLVPTGDGARVVVGVSADFRVGMGADRHPTVFIPLSAPEAYGQNQNSPYPWNSYGLILRMADGHVPDVALLSERIRQRSWAVPNWVGARRESVASKVGQDIGAPKLLALIFGTLGCVAILLAVVATYGLSNFEIQRRREEMTVRLALGATPTALRRRLAVAIVKPVLVGVLAGLPLSWIGAHLLSRSIGTTNAGDLRTYAAAAATTIVVALVAAWIPGRRVFSVRVSELHRAV